VEEDYPVLERNDKIEVLLALGKQLIK